MNLYSIRGGLLTVWAPLILGLVGCGSRGGLDASIESCVPDTSACVSPLVGQVCNRQGQWVTFQCPGTQECNGKACVDTATRCTSGATQCLTAQAAQICDQQGQWTTFACPSNQKCLDGACIATEEPCAAGTTQCIGEQVSQICDQQGQWISILCGSNQVCRDNACVASEEPLCTSGATQCLNAQASQKCSEQGQWITSACQLGQVCSDGACHEVCSPNAHECVGESLQRICLNDGSAWANTECPAGFKCANGECVGVCKAGTKQCASSKVTRECRADGSGYVEQECLQGLTCDQGKCVPDVNAACFAGNDASCKDEHTAMVCKLDGSGYELKTCAKGTSCASGRCQGTTCVAGETSCTATNVANLVGVQTCTSDGSGYTISMCRAHETCVANTSTGQYECYSPPCKEQQNVCGDPKGAQSSTDRVSRCETLADGKLGWVSYLCGAPSSCTVDEQGTAQCRADCAPGDQRCSEEHNAIENCGNDGKWARQDCDQNGGGTLACLLVPTTQKIICGDPDCSRLQYSLETYTTEGRCSAEKIRKCGDDGKLAVAVTCEEGMCLPRNDGFGACKDPSRCDHEDGWRECASDNDAYRTCKSHHWEFTLCTAKQSCTDDSQGHAACGDDCDPDTRRCSGSGIQTCQADGTWGTVKACDIGECNPITLRCEVACQPNEIRCVGDVSLASDASTLGTSGMQVCQADGSWSAIKTCAVSAGGVERCRRSGHGVALGCVECVGNEVPGGNEENAIDSRCSADGNGLQVCSSNNTWPTAITACEATEQCVKRRDGTHSGSCSNDGCGSNTSRRCVGFQTLTTPETISDCCSGECQTDTGVCLHRAAQYDPSCVETTSCFSGRYDTSGTAIYETCCNGYCRSGAGCLRIKAQACTSVSSCTVKTLGRSTVCCGACLSDGTCSKGQEAEHPVGEYYMCGNSSSLCWDISSCTWTPGVGVSGAMYADCTARPTVP